MTATSDFLPFAVGTGANVLDQTDYAASSVVAGGFTAGTASSAIMNKALRQASMVSAAIAQAMCDTLGISISDDGNLSEFKANFEAAIEALGSAGGTVSTTAWTAGRAQDRFMARASSGLTGGGTITLSSINELGWSARLIAPSLGSGVNEVATFFEILQPAAGTTIPVAGGAAARTATSNGIPLNAGEALYWLPTIDGTPDQGAFLVAYYSTAWEPPANAVLIAIFNPDNGLVKVLSGPFNLRAGDSLPTGALSSARPLNANAPAPITVTSADVTLSTTQAQAQVITVTGTLTANHNLIFPTTGKWLIVNNTTGAYNLTAKTAAGSGYIVRQGFAYDIYGDGTNIQPAGAQLFWGTASPPTLQALETYLTTSS